MKNVLFLIVTTAICFSSATFAAEITPMPANTSASTDFHGSTSKPGLKKKIPKQKAQAAKQMTEEQKKKAAQNQKKNVDNQ